MCVRYYQQDYKKGFQMAYTDDVMVRRGPRTLHDGNGGQAPISFESINAVGDGSCGFNAYALALFEMMRDGHYSVSAQDHADLFNELGSEATLAFIDCNVPQ